MSKLTATCCSALLLLGLGAENAQAKRKRKGKGGSKASIACNMSYLPFSQGKTWTYQYVIPPGVEDKPGQLKAKQAETLSITVKTVESKGSSATITLEERYKTPIPAPASDKKDGAADAKSENFSEVVVETVLTCSADELTVPLNSFFFAGELPGAINMRIENLNAKGKMFPGGAGLKRGEAHFVEIKADIHRDSAEDAKLGSPVHQKAMLELERQIEVGGTEEVEVEHGIHDAVAVKVDISGRAALESKPDKQIPLPDGAAMMWFAPSVGVVLAHNRLGQGWALESITEPEAQ